MPTAKKLTTRYWLLPHERWLARYTGMVQNSPPGGRRWQFQRMYGPQGDVVAAAYLADFLAAFILCIIGAILINVPKNHPLVAPGACLLAIGGVIGLVGMIRVFQLAQVGRDFRADRAPYNADTEIAGHRAQASRQDVVPSRPWPARQDLQPRTAGTTCAYCGEPISAAQPARLAGTGFWVHEGCQRPRP